MTFQPFHQLLHALTVPERKAVRQVFAEKKATSKYVRLFQYLDELKGDFTEEHFLQFCLHNDLKKGTLRKFKQRLSADIINTLREYHVPKDPILKLQQLLANTRILVQKERFELAKEELKKASKQERKINSASIRYEIEALMLEILFLEDHKNIEAPLQQHLDKAEKASLDFLQSATINRIYHALYRYGLRRKGQKSWQELATELAKISYPTGADLITQFHYISAHMKIATPQKEYETMLSWAQKGYEIFSANPASRNLFTRYYIAILDHNLMALALLGRYTDMPPILKELESLACEAPMHEAKKYATLIYYQLMAFCNRDAPKDDVTEKEIETLKVYFEQYQEGILPARQITIEFMFSCLYFLRHDYPNAEDYFKKFDIHKSNHLRPDLLRIVLVLQTVIIADDDQQKFQFVDPLIKRNNIRLQGWNGLHRYETITFRYCHKFNETRAKWGEHKEELYIKFYFELKATKDPDTGRYHPGAEILMKWLLPKLPDNPEALAA